MTRKGRRLIFIGGALAMFSLAIAMAAYGLRGNITLFLGPTDIAENPPSPGARLRLGGLVKEGSYVKLSSNSAQFSITDLASDIKVEYSGNEPLPLLFREGQGVIAEGELSAAGLFRSDKVLAKHDENYMSRDVVDTLIKQGKWKGPEPKK